MLTSYKGKAANLKSKAVIRWEKVKLRLNMVIFRIKKG